MQEESARSNLTGQSHHSSTTAGTTPLSESPTPLSPGPYGNGSPTALPTQAALLTQAGDEFFVAFADIVSSQMQAMQADLQGLRRTCSAILEQQRLTKRRFEQLFAAISGNDVPLSVEPDFDSDSSTLGEETDHDAESHTGSEG